MGLYLAGQKEPGLTEFGVNVHRRLQLLHELGQLACSERAGITQLDQCPQLTQVPKIVRTIWPDLQYQLESLKGTADPVQGRCRCGCLAGGVMGMNRAVGTRRRVDLPDRTLDRDIDLNSRCGGEGCRRRW